MSLVVRLSVENAMFSHRLIPYENLLNLISPSDTVQGSLCNNEQVKILNHSMYYAIIFSGNLVWTEKMVGGLVDSNHIFGRRFWSEPYPWIWNDV